MLPIRSNAIPKLIGDALQFSRSKHHVKKLLATELTAKFVFELGDDSPVLDVDDITGGNVGVVSS